MKNIVKRQYRELCDFPKVYDFMVKNYTIDCRNGSCAPFFEYSLATPWFDNMQNHRFALWEEDGEVVAFCWCESRIGQVFFNLSEGYEFLIPQMMEHAKERLRADDGKLQMMVYESQKALLEEVKKQGYKEVWREECGILDFEKNALEVMLPEGYVFEDAEKVDMQKLTDMCWRGFDNEGESPGGAEYNYHTIAAPHATPELDVLIKTTDGEYVCFAGMWWVPENKLAYLEPLCTVPEHRHKGLASAALSELYRRTSKLGATHMTGGDNEFYFNLGFEKRRITLYMEKLEE